MYREPTIQRPCHLPPVSSVADIFLLAFIVPMQRITLEQVICLYVIYSILARSGVSFHPEHLIRIRDLTYNFLTMKRATGANSKLYIGSRIRIRWQVLVF